MKVFCETFSVKLAKGPDLADISGKLEECVRAAGVHDGLLIANAVGSTGSLTTIEYEPGAVADFKAVLERLAPEGAAYRHEQAWHDGNGHSHVQAALMGPSVALAIHGGRLCLGTWQQVVAVNHDVRARRRTVAVTVTGRAG